MGKLHARRRVWTLVIVGAVASGVVILLTFDGSRRDAVPTDGVIPADRRNPLPETSLANSDSQSFRARALGKATAGAVRYENGDPAAGCRLEFLDRSQVVLQTTETSRKGRFLVESLPDDAVQVRVSPPHGPATDRAIDRSEDITDQAEAMLGERQLPDIVIPDVSLLPLEVVGATHGSQDAVVHATISHPKAALGFLVPPVAIHSRDLASGTPCRVDVIVPSRGPVNVAWSIGSEWSWHDKALATHVTRLNPARIAEYFQCTFNVGECDILAGYVKDGADRPVPQVRVSVRWTLDAPGGKYSHTRADGSGRFEVGALASWPGKARAALDGVAGEWTEFKPGEDVVVRFAHPLVRLLVASHDGSPVTTCSFRPQCLSTRDNGRVRQHQWRAHLRDCPDGAVIAAVERISEGARYFIHVPGFGETAHVFERTVEAGEADPYVITLPESPTTTDLELDVQLAESVEGRLDLALHELAAGPEPMRYSLSLLGRSGPIKVEAVQHGKYRYEAKIGKNPTTRTGIIVVSGETIPSLRLAW